MALTLQRIPDGEDVQGRMRIRFVDAVFDTSYPTGGYIVNASDLGMKMIYSVDLAGQNTFSETWLYTFNINAAVGTATITGVPATSFGLKAFTAVNSQLGNGSSALSGGVVRLAIVGR